MKRLYRRSSLLAGILAAILLCSCKPAAAQCPQGATHCEVVTEHTENGTTTSTSWDNRAQAAAKADAIQQATAVGMAYLILVRPALTTMRNERINGIEGRFTPAYQTLEILTSADLTSVPSQKISSMPELKHHHLGESWAAFLAAAPQMQAQATTCATKKRPEANAKRRTFHACGAIWHMSDDPRANETFYCMEPGYGVGKDILCQDFNGEVNFSAGKLASLKLVLADSWSESLPIMTEKFGHPSAGDRDGTFRAWKNDSYSLIATELGGDTALYWMTADEYKARSARERSLLGANGQMARDSW